MRCEGGRKKEETMMSDSVIGEERQRDGERCQ